MKKVLIGLSLGMLFVGSVCAGSDPAQIIKTVRVDPLLFNAATGLTVEPVLVDETADYTFEYKWMLNGEELLFESTASFPGELFHRDDEVAVIVAPIDAEGNGLKPFVSSPLKAVNTSPAFDSDPPTSFYDKKFSCSVVASDLDGDTLSYSLEGAPEGMTIDSSSGLLNWSFAGTSEGVFEVLVVVEDGFGGRAEQRMELDLSYAAKGAGQNE